VSHMFSELLNCYNITANNNLLFARCIHFIIQFVSLANVCCYFYTQYDRSMARIVLVLFMHCFSCTLFIPWIKSFSHCKEMRFWDWLFV